MRKGKTPSKTIDDYISSLAPEMRSVIEKIRQMVKAAAPDSTEKISYGIPAFERKRIILWFGAFKDHFSLFPPINGDEELAMQAKPFANDKGNLIFHYEKPIPYDLVEKVINQKVQQNGLINAAKKKHKKP